MPGCSPVFDPLYQLASFRRLLARYDIRPCERQSRRDPERVVGVMP